MKPFLILQVRPETDAADDEYAAILDKCGLPPNQTLRVRLDQQDIPADLDLVQTAGVIVGGGPGCFSDPVNKKDPLEALMEARALAVMPQIIAQDHPFMGCCYGLGLLTHSLGGHVSKERYGEPVGPTICTQEPAARDDPLLAGLEAEFEAFVGHKEAVQALPDGAVHLLGSAPCPFQMIRYGQNVYATQFHPEADAHDFERRIRVYRNHGYFPAQDADRLIAACHGASVTVPGEIMRRFAQRYGG